MHQLGEIRNLGFPVRFASTGFRKALEFTEGAGGVVYGCPLG